MFCRIIWQIQQEAERVLCTNGPSSPSLHLGNGDSHGYSWTCITASGGVRKRRAEMPPVILRGRKVQIIILVRIGYGLTVLQQDSKWPEGRFGWLGSCQK